MNVENSVFETHIVSVLVENKPGVLYRVANLFRRRNFNIESISVGPTERKEFSRMTITLNGDNATVEQLVKQLSKIVDVVKISLLNPRNTILRELALIKLHVKDSKVRSDILSYAQIFKGKVVDAAEDTMTVEVIGTPEKINAFLKIASSIGIKEMARTGLTAIERGG
ncbi:MAG: acetolactate synthase small subunit [Nitrososphaeria archaeon]|nr:acetolactate synthase small subunit [Nitrososphaeria archaeon]